ncbi:MAG: class I SAM-dependent methyltransferase [Woeseiaceae bacterium]
MPIKTWDLKADFDGAYNIGLEPDGHPNTRSEIRGGYERSALFNASDPRLDYTTKEWGRILALFGAQFRTSARILIVGCGFGWSMERLVAGGYTNVWGVDTSAYIQAEKAAIDSRSGIANALQATRILNFDLTTAAGRTDCLAASIGADSRFDIIVTERVLSSLSDAEVTQMSSDLASMLVASGGLILHIETPPAVEADRQRLDMNFRTLDAIKTLVGTDSVISSSGRESR